MSSITILGTCHLPGKTLINVFYYIHPSPFNSVEVFFKTLLTVKSKSDSVSSMIILGACHLPGKILIYVLYYMHLPPFNSVEVLKSSGKIVCTVSSKSDSVSSIPILEACHLLEKTVIDVLYHMHLPPFNSVEVFSKNCAHCQK